MQHLQEAFDQQSQWFADNVVMPAGRNIIISNQLHCGVPMQQYVGNQFVDWTHRCTVCHVMYGCA